MEWAKLFAIDFFSFLSGDSVMDFESTMQRNRAVQRLRRIGMTLVEGPRSLLPPEQLDDFGWLEPNLRLILRHGFVRHSESVTVFCDNTVNRDSAFLAPVLRYARWVSAPDFKTLPAWPHVEIQLSYFDAQRDWVSEQIRRIEAALIHPPYMPFGLNTQRDAPEVEIAEDRGNIEIHCYNGLQTIELFSPALPAGDPLTDAFFAVFTGLRAIMEPISRDGWQEAYDDDPTTNVISHSWYWNGQVPKDETD
jgi:hypothetical protein